MVARPYAGQRHPDGIAVRPDERRSTSRQRAPSRGFRSPPRSCYALSVALPSHMIPTLDAAEHVVIVSDMHIGDGARTEAFAGADDRFRRFLSEVATQADALVIAGDGFDLAQAWSIDRIYARHRRLVDELVSLARQIPVYYLRGNHDQPLTELRRLLPLRYAPQLRIGRGIQVEHGNRFDPRNQPGDSKAFWGARAHTMLERVIRSPVRIPMRKHYLWSTRLGHWLFFRYGRLVLRLSRLNDALGRPHIARHQREFLDYWGRGEWGDIHGILAGVESALRQDTVHTLVCGHSHTPGRIGFPVGTYVNTGSWTYGAATYARVDDGRCSVFEWPGGREMSDEEYRGVLGPNRDKSFFDWWEAFYRGWFRYDVPAMDRAATTGSEV